MKDRKFVPNRKHVLALSISAIGVMATMPAFAETEFEMLKKELAEQRLVINALLAAQEKTAAKVDAQVVSAPATAAQKGGAATPELTFYGTVDVNIASTDSGFGNKTTVGTGGMTASSVGVKGVRSIGDGLKVLGEVEAGIDLTTGVAGNGAAGTTGLNRTIPSSGGLVGTGNQIFSRQAYAGISSDSVGTITVGRQYSGSYIVTAAFSNALGAGFYGNSITFIPVVGGMPTRLNSSVVYRTPNLNGFTGQLTYAFGSENNISTPKPTAPGAATSTTDNAGVGYDLAMFYKAGSFSAALGTWDVNAASYVTAGETGLAKRQGWQGAVNYDFGVAKVYATYISGTIKGGNYENVTKTLSDSDGSSVSVSVPFGKHKFYASYARLNDKSLLDRSANSTGVAYSYDLYKNTRLYGSWGKISNNSNAFYSLANGGDLVGNVTAAGSNATGFMVGLNSSF